MLFSLLFLWFESSKDDAGFPRAVRCECGDELKLSATYYLNQHVASKHKPAEVKKREEVEKAETKAKAKRDEAVKALGTRGQQSLISFFAASREKGEQDRQVSR